MSETKFEDTIGFVMTKDPITVDLHTTVRAALQKMIQHDIGSLIVVNGETWQPMGIITERDVMRRSLDSVKETAIYDMPVEGIMTQPLIAVPPTTPVWDALEMMMTKKIRRLPVVDKHLIGIVTERDIFKWVLRIVYQPNVPNGVRELLQ